MMKRTFHCIIVCTLIILSTLHISKNGTIIYDNNYKIDYGRVDISILIKLLKPFNCTKGEIRILLNYKPLIIQNKNNQNELANLLMRKKSILSDDTEN